MTTEEGAASSRRRGKSSILSHRSTTDARPRRLDVPSYAKPITMEIYACGLD